MLNNMPIQDLIILLLTGLVAIYMLFVLLKRPKDSANIYMMIAFAVLLVAGLLLIVLGWGILNHDLIAVVSTLIPFSMAIGLIAKFHPNMQKGYLGLMVVGLILIAIARFADIATMSKIVYPLFHGIAGLTIFIVPIAAVKAGKAKGAFICVTIGGGIIGIGGIALAFIKAGRPLPVFTLEVVMMILSTVLFLTALFWALGIQKGEN